MQEQWTTGLRAHLDHVNQERQCVCFGTSAVLLRRPESGANQNISFKYRAEPIWKQDSHCNEDLAFPRFADHSPSHMEGSAISNRSGPQTGSRPGSPDTNGHGSEPRLKPETWALSQLACQLCRHLMIYGMKIFNKRESVLFMDFQGQKFAKYPWKLLCTTPLQGLGM